MQDVRIVDDDVHSPFRTALVEVAELSQTVARVLDRERVCGRAVSNGHASEGFLERNGEKDREIPIVPKFETLKKDAFDDQDCQRWGRSSFGMDHAVRPMIERSVPVDPASTGTERVQNGSPELSEIERVPEEAIGGGSPTSVADRPQIVKVINTYTDCC